MRFKRLIRHLTFAPWRVRRAFPHATLAAIAKAIHAAEQAHGGEIRFAVEGALDLPELWRGLSARERAIEVFSLLHVWDTERNDGVLIYLLLAERDVEIVADRGLRAQIGTQAWEQVCRGMEALLRQGRFEAAALHGVAEVSRLLCARGLPPMSERRNELPDWPVVLRL
ncbi:TPM domain-containing protein [Thiomonas bhubaneswarensis]|uniref:TLP18.3, Psb32 and MOLO-1 founding proteins of phosphatase n=1 Tax=Thiomonas bhubaneswarensis TaxID=339866 RepID=A0A0K6HQT1_9BURK|nr:TPM domain-containing protein [Thiomonas bhubaneswarensis]CUA93407.1 TLP18.3, Psb32 and MOLO-1 founding proteins of phosphatase [Thiomonas bhubaneswarensis]